MKSLKEANRILSEFEKIANTNQTKKFDHQTGYKVGVDLGTSSIVLVVLDSQNQPIFGAYEFADVIRDGLVVNYQKSVEIVTRLKEQAEKVLGFTLTAASGAIPPGTIGNNKRVVANVIESAGMVADQLVDEPTAAAKLLKIETGAVIDVGGGTTGISVFEKGQPIHVVDEPTGGTHMTLVLAGYFSESYADAEARKRDASKEKENFAIVRPTVQRMAEITRQALVNYQTEPLVVVGGAAYFQEFEAEFSKYLQQTVYKPVFPQFVTPIGIAMSSQVIISQEA
ncbi:ethanolamine utilization protein EutJ [Enterococcus sp. PF1-24]|uniref:ethanolamine utilization protein EutJ n=1 Tax=unclassified Enterococcus TaxID=2608891 RepID=UPI0024746CF8|nr:MULTISPECIES: ethanolamine utilization protein EutJ [unclassified Enterococcus]MDH6365450.1 ethanolamine utilization protein EutJ [Enterococcus sp. PFB1-1]MDH6402551.1 ethanolamine utilization protein EutJ [Enterococcus sp. PF1-24]